MNKKQLKKMVDWMYSKDNPNHEYNKKTNPSKTRRDLLTSTVKST